MFIGHYGVGLAINKPAPALSLGLLFLAVQFLDLLWPTLLLLNVEHVAINTDKSYPLPLVFTNYPYSHSLLMAAVWAMLFTLVYGLIKRDWKSGGILGFAVFSHWILDFVVHLKDLPLYPGSDVKLGLELWRYGAIESIIEGILFLLGLVAYLRATKPKNRKGSVLFWILVSLLVLSHVANEFSHPPTSVSAVAWSAQALWLFVLLGFWADRNREPRNH